MAENGVAKRSGSDDEPPKGHDPSEPLSIVRADVALREAEFMRLYLRGPVGVRYSGRECARLLGYSGDDKALTVRASEILHRPRNMLKIQRALDREDAAIERVVHELSCMAFYNAKDFFTWDAAGVHVKPSTELDDDLLAAVVGVKQNFDREGKLLDVELKLADKTAALAQLGRLRNLVGPVDPDGSESRPFTLILGAQHVTVQQNGHPTNGAAPTNGGAGETQ